MSQVPREDEERDLPRRLCMRAGRATRPMMRLTRRLITAVRLHRLHGELLFRASAGNDYSKPIAGSGGIPQVPLILGDKWDF